MFINSARRLATALALCLAATACKDATSVATAPLDSTPAPSASAPAPSAGGPTTTAKKGSAPVTTEFDDPAKRTIFCDAARKAKAEVDAALSSDDDIGQTVVRTSQAFQTLPRAAHTAYLRTITKQLADRYSTAATFVAANADLARTNPVAFATKVGDAVAPALEPFSYVDEYTRQACGFTLLLTDDGSPGSTR